MNCKSDKVNKSVMPIWRVYTQSAFLICVILLALAGSSMSVIINKFEIYLKKEPLALKKSLDLLDQASLSPYRVTSKKKIANNEIVKSLGTSDYIEWLLEDTSADVGDPLRYCFLFITYYDLPDRVPHVPEECYSGGGYQQLVSEEIAFDTNEEGVSKKIPGKYLVFADTASNAWQSGEKFSVLYFIRVNGVYAGNREDARLSLNKNIFGKYSYFSKVEWCFLTKQGSRIYVDKEDAIKAGGKLLNVILPILEDWHWPDMNNKK